MSGFVGLFHQGDRPVARPLLGQMIDLLARRGPDERGQYLNGSVGLGHALLRTTFEDRPQPLSLDGLRIVADVRLDARPELLDKLSRQGQEAPVTASDAELILQAYRAWGPACVQHLAGDFSFAIWDEEQQQLFGARDHFGLARLYYAPLDGGLAVSNTMDCLRLHPAVSERLNEQVIGDILLFRHNRTLDSTFWADLRQLPPAHTLTWRAGELRLERYWTLPTDRVIRYRHGREYVDHFLELFEVAVKDRLRLERVAILMSGGMDSTAIAATAQMMLNRGDHPACELRAFTNTAEALLPAADEGYYAGLVAEALHIPIQYTRLGEEEATPHLPRQHSPVVLSGRGGDPLQRPEPGYFGLLAQAGRLGLLAGDLAHFGWYNRRRLRRLPWRWLLRPPGPPDWARLSYPDWLNPDFAARLDLPARWQEAEAAFASPVQRHPLRPTAYQEILMPLWPNLLLQRTGDLFEREPAQMRYPFFDLRLVNFMLAIASFPWCHHKNLLRLAMAGRLPAAVRKRPKQPVPGNLLQARAQQGLAPGFNNREGQERLLAPYVDLARLRRLLTDFVERGESGSGSIQAPLILANWLVYGQQPLISTG